MKRILLKIDDEVYENIKSLMLIKMISESAYGEVDEFLILLIKSIDAGKKEVSIIKKKDEEGDQTNDYRRKVKRTRRKI
jgi:hypothetical protein